MMNQSDVTNDKKPKEVTMTKNFIFNLCIQIVMYIIPLITSPYLSRVLTPEGIGNNSFVNSISSYFTLVIGFGFLTYGTKAIAECKKDKQTYSKVFWNIVICRWVLFILCFSLYFCLAYFWGFGGEVDKSLFLVYSLVLFSASIDITYLYQGLENFRTISIIHIVCNSISAILYFALVKTKSDLLIYALIYTCQTVAVALISWLFAAKYLSRLDFHDIHILKTLKSGLFYFLPTIAISVYTVLDRTMLGYLSSKEEVGFYEQAYKIISLVTALMNAISPVMLSRISSLVKAGNEPEVRKKTIQMGEVYFLLGCPCLFGLYGIANHFVPAFFGDEYLPAIGVLYFLIPLIIIIPISNQIGSIYYVPRNKINITTYFFIAGALLNFVTNFIFIRFWGAKGAAITSLIAETLISSLFIIFSFKKVPYFDMVKKGIKPLIASLVMFGVIVLLDLLVLDRYALSDVVDSIIILCVGIITYGIMLLVLRENLVINMLYKIFHIKRRRKNEK